MQTKTIMEMMLMILVVGIIVFFVSKSAPTLMNSILNNLGVETGQNQEKVVNAFTQLQTNYESCFSSQKKECICNFDISILPKTYRIVINGRVISLEKKDTNDPLLWKQVESSLKKSKFVGKNMACYLNSWDIKNGGTINNFEGEVILSYSGTTYLENIYQSKQTKYYFINNHPLLYKKDDNSICFVLDNPQNGKSILDEEAKSLISNNQLEKC